MAYRKFNIYEGVHISRKILSIGIVIGLVALIFAMVFGSREGFTASFDTGGGQVITEQHLRYGEKVKEPPTPIRDGYVFDGWYADSARTQKFDFEHQQLIDDITLYAAWHESNATVGARINENKNPNHPSSKQETLK